MTWPCIVLNSALKSIQGDMARSASLAWCIKSYCSLNISISGHSNCNCFILDSIERGCDLAMHRPELGTQVHSRRYGSLASLAWCIKSYCSLNISISGHSNCNCFILDSIERGCDLAMHRPELGTQVHSRRYGSLASLAWCIKSYCSLNISIPGHSNCNCFILDSIERGCDLAMHRPELGTQVHSRRYGSLASLAWCIKSYCILNISISGHSN